MIGQARIGIGRFELNVDRGSLQLNGSQVPLRPKSFDVLRYLAENADRVVSKEELLEAIWPNVITTDETVFQCICDIRKALGANGAQYIRTVPRRGYILSAQEAEGEQTSKTGSHRTRIAVLAGTASACLLLGVAYAALVDGMDASLSASMLWSLGGQTETAAFSEAAPAIPSIAVLAFENLSGRDDQVYLSDGITESIISRLARQPNMLVIDRNSSFSLKGKSISVGAIGKEFGVRYVLSGSVHRIGNRIRIMAQLVDAFSGKHVWVEDYDRKMRDLFAIQDDIASRITTELAVKLTAGEGARTEFNATDSIEAYDYWLRGVTNYRNFSKESNLLAGELFRKSIALDPSYARAVSYLGWVRLNEARFKWGANPDDSLARAEDLAKQAIDIDENDMNAHILRSRISTLRKDFGSALAAGRRAIEIEPNNADAYASYGLTLTLSGQPEQALPYLMTARRLSPFAPAWYPQVESLAYYLLGRYERSIASSREVLARSRLGGMARYAWARLIAAEVHLGQLDEAIQEAKAFIELHPDYSVDSEEKWLHGYVYQDRSWFGPYIDALRHAGLPD